MCLPGLILAVLFPPVPHLPVFRIGWQGLRFGEYLQVNAVAPVIDGLFSYQSGDRAAGLGPVLAIPESAAGFLCPFKSREMGGEFGRGNVDEAEIVKAWRIDQFTATREIMQR